MDKLKQEVDMDEHKLHISDLCKRLGTHPDNVKKKHNQLEFNLI